MTTFKTTQKATDSKKRDLNSELSKMKAMEEFIKLKPPLFAGEVEPPAAEAWLAGIKSALDSTGAPREHRVTFAAYLFEGPAEEWWDSEGSDFDRDTDWNLFEALFRRQFATGAADRRLAEGLRTLKQNEATVVAYHDRFVELCRHDPVKWAVTALKCAAFKRGLRPDLRLAFRRLNFDRFEELVALAARLEAEVGGAGGGPRACLLCCTAGHVLARCPQRQAEGATVEEYRVTWRFEGADQLYGAVKFRAGLRLEIREALNRSSFRGLDELVRAAKRAEAALGRAGRCPSCTERTRRSKGLSFSGGRSDRGVLIT